MPVRNDFKPGEFCWVDLNAHDLDAAAAWYGNLLGWSHQLMDSPGGAPPYAFLTKGEAVVGGIGQMSDEMKAMGVPTMWNCYVSSDDCTATEARVQELGGSVTVPTMEVPGHGKLAFFSDPGGASFAAWQSTSDDGPGLLVGEPGGMCWNELMTRDVDQAKEFYGSLAGWDCSAVPMGDVEYTMARLGGKDAAGMMAMDGEQWEGVPPHWMVYFAVADCRATAEAAAASGGRVHMPPTPIPVGTFSLLADAQGGMFAIVELSQANS